MYDEKKLYDNFNKYAPYIKEDLLAIRDNTNNELLISKINNYLDKNPRIISSYITNRVTLCDYETDTKLFNQVVLLMLKDIVKNTNSRISNFKYLDEGNHSVVFKISDKVLKIGKNRGTIKFHNNPYIIKPLLRRFINFNIDYFFEITEFVDTDGFVAYEELYNLYRGLRELKLVWVDVCFENVGRLKKDNKIYWNSKLDLSDKVLNLYKYLGNKELKRGDIVILDADYIFHERDNRIYEELLHNSIFRDLELRYKKETGKTLTLQL